MPYVHTYGFQVRHYECDAYGAVNPANYLRYMQEAAFAGSAAVGYTPQRYTEIGYWWLAYETDIHYMQPLHYGDVVSIETWVVDFRRVRSLRNYDFYRDGERVIHATTDWVLIDIRTMQPASVPDDMIAAYAQGDTVKPAPPREKQLPQTAPFKNAFRMRRHVHWSEIDPAQHVNNAVYMNYALDCAVAAQEHYGWSVPRLRDAGLQVKRHQIEYKAAAVLGDEIEVATWLSDIKETSFIQHTTITRLSDNKLLTRIRALVEGENLAGFMGDFLAKVMF